MTDRGPYDVAIAGGGLAGLAAAILLAKSNYSVVLFEKEKYPFHKVCGEYISLESRQLLMSLGFHVNDFDLPVIDTLQLTSPDATELMHRLPLGGIGVSRYKIDNDLKKIAEAAGVIVMEGTKVNDVTFNNEQFTLKTDAGDITAAICCAATGKRSNLDIKWKRNFTTKKANALNNYVGVKYHAKLDHPRNLIALHNFANGYCGISPIEDNISCVCYLTNAHNLRNAGNDIKKMEEAVLFRNDFIKNAFRRSAMLYEKPLTISQISFDKKEQVHDHVLMIGDSAGMIAPLCGNGMSMALVGAEIAATLVVKFLRKEIDRAQLERDYQLAWNKQFARRLSAGRIIQSLFGNSGSPIPPSTCSGVFPAS